MMCLETTLPAPRLRRALGVRMDLISPCVASRSLSAPQPYSTGALTRRPESAVRAPERLQIERVDALQRRELVHVEQVLSEQILDRGTREIDELDAHGSRWVFIDAVGVGTPFRILRALARRVPNGARSKRTAVGR